MIKRIDNNTETKKDFDFDFWCRLAKDDPEAFEVARKKEIDNYISALENVSTKERMQRLQWRIEIERQRSKNPMDAAIRIYDMMWESVGRNFEAIQTLAEFLNPQGLKTGHSLQPQAKVLKFRREEHTGTNG